MKIKDVEVEISTIYYLETDADIFPTYRRFGSGVWERLMGESWESCYGDEKELEALFREWELGNDS